MRSRKETRTAGIPIRYGAELTRAAQTFGVSTKFAAHHLPGNYGKPVVGFDRDYWLTQSRQAYRDLILGNSLLKTMFDEAHQLSGEVYRGVSPAFRAIDGLAVDAACEVGGVVAEIQGTLDRLDPQFFIAGKWVERTFALSSFALRKINEEEILYRDRAEDVPANTAEYWAAIVDHALEPANKDSNNDTVLVQP